ncbi:hypothetical protein PFISCL1PPCAC_4230, partial [Pristionchus fissidentatus]
PVQVPQLQAGRRTCRSPCMLRSSPFHHGVERPGLRGILGITAKIMLPYDFTGASGPKNLFQVPCPASIRYEDQRAIGAKGDAPVITEGCPICRPPFSLVPSFIVRFVR